MMHIMSVVWTHLISYSQWTDEKDEEEFDLVHLDTADAADAAAAAAATVTFPAKIEVGHWCYCCCRNVEM